MLISIAEFNILPKMFSHPKLEMKGLRHSVGIKYRRFRDGDHLFNFICKII